MVIFPLLETGYTNTLCVNKISMHNFGELACIERVIKVGIHSHKIPGRRSWRRV